MNQLARVLTLWDENRRMLRRTTGEPSLPVLLSRELFRTCGGVLVDVVGAAGALSAKELVAAATRGKGAII